ncbi:MAG TPA: MarR family transcriptional regulator [Dehalococcoidia bacterium]|nr:MarR family transcriptional regulator [Dehalococcoidia bacterium]
MNKSTAVGQAAALNANSQRTLASYTNAFPDADAEALAAHLAVTSTAGFLTRGIEARIQALGFELSRPRYTIVRTLYLSPDNAIAQSELAQVLRVSGPNITQLIDGLVAEGWVERVVNPADRRVVHARLTREGKQRAARLVPAIVEYMQDSCNQLSADEQAELCRLLDKVRLAVERRDQS